MRRGSVSRDIFWTTVFFVGLVAGTFFFILLENYLENFKSH